ncbi:endonuclease IV [Vulcanisaeta sp. EB80]|jgi:deoxyribonuclease-4|uniref:TIM barrel protein n=1 Tax=Vulcanisaeta sp. EB80 TaxID=1650660 RepID=UPI0009BD409A|nr:deoxyribonuclease IV [Vulcanisaeta sp. EB80]PLC68144.1 endonuclease IV [Vulcanisaeta sp. EB80]PVU72730.1 endonuclease IV [Vulcanisaeta sp. SCGC AB-777_J10]
MARVYIGPAGVPIGARERKKSAGTLDGIRYVSEVGLNAMEVEFVQGVRMNREAAQEAGELARELGVRLSVHAPYFINLCSEEAEKVEASIKRLQESLDRGETMGATVVVFHPAYYGKLGPEGCYNAVKDAVLRILDWMRESGITHVRLGLEVMARKSQFGSLEETFRLVREVNNPQVVAVIDWGHVYARNGGSIDYRAVLNMWREYFGDQPMHTHFTCVKYKNGEWVDEHEPMDTNNPPFEPLARELAGEDIEITIINESPLLEKDALRMKDILIKYGNKIVGANQ